MIFDPSPFISHLPRAVVAHVGGNFGEERETYRSWGSRVYWWEPRPEAASELRRNCPDDVVVEAAAGESAGRGVMRLSSGGQSSSLLRPTGHLAAYPHISFEGELEVSVLPLDMVVARADGLVVDTQGYEDRVLHGATRLLGGLSWAFIEVYKEDLYEGGARIEDLDSILSGFRRVETVWAGAWGDALWVREQSPTPGR